MSAENKTFGGVPFFEKEGQVTLDVTLQNLDDRLNELDVDANIIVQINGPETALGKQTGLEVDQSKYNATIELNHVQERGQAASMNILSEVAAERGIDRYFLTDADVYRFPHSLEEMWKIDPSYKIIGAKYRPYPIKIVQEQFGALTWQEKMLYHVFDGDQTPEARGALARNGLARKPWVKASLMLVDSATARDMHGNQVNATDSVMNRIVSERDIAVSEDAYFMHMGRVDMTDHIMARLRHFRAAKARGQLDIFLQKEIGLPSDEIMNAVAKDIRSSSDRGDYYAMLYLCRCAVREAVNDICTNIANNTWNLSDLDDINPMSMKDVKTIRQAREASTQFFADVHWDQLLGYGIEAPPTTQERLRQPFLLDRFLQETSYRDRIVRSLGARSLSVLPAVPEPTNLSTQPSVINPNEVTVLQAE